MIARFLGYLMSGPHAIDWQAIGGLGMILAAMIFVQVVIWLAVQAAARRDRQNQRELQRHVRNL